MLILAIDTSGRQGSIALASVQGPQLKLLAQTPLDGGRYSEQLMLAIAALLESHGVDRSSIGLIAVASGPGSFTGLRVAIATTKGLAEPFGTPVVAVSVLQAMAFTSGVEGRVIAVLDAQRSEVFFGEYSIAAVTVQPVQKEHEALASFSDFKEWLDSSGSCAAIVTPDTALATRLREANIAVTELARPRADVFANIAYRKFLTGFRSDISTLDANYLRRSDAEIFFTPNPR